MLRTNLSTRPFYNDRGVKAVLAGLAAVAVLLTLFNAYEIMQLRGQSKDARDTIAGNDAQARDLRTRAGDIRRSIDTAKLQAVQTAAREANALIDRRTFSWTELLNQFQTTLPPEVRIAGVMPQIDAQGRRLVQITVFSRRVEDLETFMDALEKTGTFSGVLPRSDNPEQDGTIRSELQAYYKPAPDPALPPRGAAAGQAGNQSASSESASASAKAEPR